MSKQNAVEEPDMNDLMETFLMWDNRGDGKIAASQLGDVLRSMNLNPTEQEIHKCGYSQNPDTRISWETYYPILQTCSKSASKPPLGEIVEGFKIFDKDQNGQISVAEFRHICTSLGEKLTDDEVDQLIEGREDAQGNINYEELIKSVFKG